MKWLWGNPTRPAVTADVYDAEPPQIFTNADKANTVSSRGLNGILFLEEDDADVCRFGFDSRGFDWIRSQQTGLFFALSPAVRAPAGMYQPVIRSGLAVPTGPLPGITNSFQTRGFGGDWMTPSEKLADVLQCRTVRWR